MNESDLAALECRINHLENTMVQLADFAMMTTLWLTVITDQETIELTKRWFERQLDQILTSCDQSQDTRDHLLRFARAFEQMHALPRESPVREKLWRDLVQQLRREAESPLNA